MSKIILVAVLAVLTADVSAQAVVIDAQTGKYLGNANNNRLDPNSISNPMGRYGSSLSSESINNPMSRYGNPLSSGSVNNPFSSGYQGRKSR